MVSIAMTTYNGEKYLHEQIESILNQSIKDFELIISDDCSTDSTYLILQEYAIKDSRIQIYRNKINIGFTKNFQIALSKCRAEYIAISDQDDIWLPNHLEVLMTHIKDNLCVCCNADLFIFDKVTGKFQNSNIKMSETLCCDFIPNNPEDIFKFILFNNFAQGAAMMIDRKLLELAIPFPTLGYYYDHWLAIISAMFNRICFLDISILLYRQHKEQITENKTKSLVNFVQRSKKNTPYYSKRLESLQSVQKVVPQDYFNYFINSVNFFSNQRKITLRLKNMKFFFINYKKIYSKNDYKFSLFRAIKLLFARGE